MRLHDLEFFRRKGTGLFQDAVFDADLAHIVQLGRDAHGLDHSLRQPEFAGDHHGVARDAVGVTARVGILFVDRASEHLNRVQEQVAVFFGGVPKVLHKVFELLGHGVEGLRQLADFSMAVQVDALREVATGNRTAGLREDPERFGNPARRIEAYTNTQENGEDGEQPRRALHLVDAAIGFALRLLAHDRPTQRADGTIGAQRFHRSFSGHHSKFLGFDELRFTAAVDEVADNLHARHVLPGSEFRAGGGDQASLAVDHVGHHAAVAGVAQTPHQKIKILDAGDHSQKASAGENRSGDQGYRARFATAAQGEGLSAIGSVFARGSVRSLQLTLQKSVRQNAPGGDPLGVGIEQRGIGQVVGGRNKVLQQRAQLGTLHALRSNITPAGYLHRVGEVGEHHM